MRDLLLLCHRIPYPPNKGDKIRSWNLLRHLSRDFRVHLGCFVDDPADLVYRDRLREVCGETHFATLNPVMGRIASLAGLVTGGPLTLGYYRDRGMSSWVRRVIAEKGVRHAVIFSSAMAQYLLHCPQRPETCLLDLVDVDSEKWGQYAAARPWPMSCLYRREQRTLQTFERQAAMACDATVLVSEDEADLFRSIAPESADRVFALENGVDAEFFDPTRKFDNPFSAESQAIVFTGAMDYWPNIDAVTWFVREVFPHVRTAEPTAEFWIVGSSPAADVQRLKTTPGVRVTGRVPDIRPYLAHARVVVAPLRMAQGIQNKVLEAMAMARPIVATAKALTGIDAMIGRDARCAPESGDEFAGGVIATLRDPSADAMGAQGRQLVETHYQWSACLRPMDRLLSEAAGHPSPMASLRPRETAPC